MSRTDVAIIDSGGANIASLRYAFKRLGVDAALTTSAARIRAASHVVLPGVGAAADAMQRLTDKGLDDLVPALSQPVLGICLGMQLLATASDEDDAACLDVVPGVSRRLNATPAAPVPNMGWCRVGRTTDHPLLAGIDDGSWFYFVHSYALPVGPYTVATAEHTGPFTAVLAKDNFVATQFHPERSADAGARLLRNFVGMSS